MKTIRIFLLCCFAFLSVIASSAADKVTLHTSASLDKILIEISSLTGYNFNYSDQEIDPTRHVTVDADSLPVETVLESLFKDQGVSFKIKGSNIYLFPVRSSEKTSGQSADSRKIITPNDY